MTGDILADLRLHQRLGLAALALKPHSKEWLVGWPGMADAFETSLPFSQAAVRTPSEVKLMGHRGCCHAIFLLCRIWEKAATKAREVDKVTPPRHSGHPLPPPSPMAKHMLRAS